MSERNTMTREELRDGIYAHVSRVSQKEPYLSNVVDAWIMDAIDTYTKAKVLEARIDTARHVQQHCLHPEASNEESYFAVETYLATLQAERNKL